MTHGTTLTLDAGTNDFAIYSRGGREYFLIEHRRRAGRDASLPDEGLAIWHVDEDGDNSHEQMTTGSHYELSLEQADGLFQLERQRNQIGDPGDLFAGPTARFSDITVPDSKWWNGTSSNLTIEQVSSAGDSITFRCLLSDTTTPAATLTRTSTPSLAIPENDLGTVIELHPKGLGGKGLGRHLTHMDRRSACKRPLAIWHRSDPARRHRRLRR